MGGCADCGSGKFEQIDDSSFVDRLQTLIRMVKALVENNVKAKRIEVRPDVERSLQLLGSGDLYGAGKTTISPILYQCLQRVCEREQKVVYCKIMTIDSPYAM